MGDLGSLSDYRSSGSKKVMGLEKLSFHRAEFIKSAVARDAFPERDIPHIVFAGKSNVRKSSVINRLVNRKNFAKSALRRARPCI